MKGILIPVVSMTVLCLHGDTPEEVSRFIRETVEEAVQPNTPEHRERWYRMVSKLETIERDVRIPVYCEIMAEKFDDPNPKYVNHIILRLYALDGSELASYGNQEALGWTRRVLREKGKGFDTGLALRYVLLKGDERDLDVIHPYRKDILAMRVAGTNIVNHPYFDNRLNAGPAALQSVIPSVTNTGPQALYVEAIIRQYWDRLETEYHEEDTGRERPFRDASKIPAELLTMVVWFDEDGNPVCNVDLEKYGLTMPELDVPNKPKGKEKPSPPLEGERPREPETSGGIQPPEQTPPAVGCRRHFWLYAGVAVLTLGIGYFYVWRKISKD